MPVTTVHTDVGGNAGANPSPSLHDSTTGRNGGAKLRAIREYGVALAAILVALSIRFALDPYLADHLPYVTFFVAVAATTWYGGLGPSLTAVVLGALLSKWFFMAPRYSLNLVEVMHQIGYAAYFAVSLAFVGFGQALRRARQRAEATSAQYENQVKERMQAEEALYASEQRLQRVLETDAVGILFFDRSGTVVQANDVFLRMTGYGREQIERRELTWRKMTPPEWIETSEAQLEQFARTGRIGPYEKEYFMGDGSRRWMLFAGRDLGDETIAEYCVDIHDRKQAEQALRK